MSYQVIARKWRPQKFDDVIGQQAVTRTLRNALGSGRLAQSFVFAGPRGVGKTTTARILARALNCMSGPTADPCGTCEACVEIAEGRDMDGSMRDAQSKLDQVIAFTGKTITIEDVAAVLGLVGRDLLLDALTAVADENAAAAFELAGRAVELGYDLRAVCRELARMNR